MLQSLLTSAVGFVQLLSGSGDGFQSSVIHGDCMLERAGVGVSNMIMVYGVCALDPNQVRDREHELCCYLHNILDDVGGVKRPRCER